MRLLRTLGRWLRQAAAGVLALLILFEEWGWEPLQRALARVPLWRWLDHHIPGLPPRWALAVLLLPSLLLLPVKLLALWLIGQGQVLLGSLVVVLAKLLGTALVARLFTLTRPALMQMPWFAQAYGRWSVWKEGWLARVRASWAWRSGRALKRLVRLRWARWQRG